MIALQDIAVVLLAAGQSRRFGDADKLSHPLDGKPLALHIGQTLAAMPLGWKFAVCPSAQGELPMALQRSGFEIVVNDDPAEGQGHSLSLGARAVAPTEALAVLVCLADMPFVTREHLQALAERFDPRLADIVASSAGDDRGPPALFAVQYLPQLISLTGDRGAKGLLQSAALVPTTLCQLTDLDRPEDFPPAAP